MTNTAHRLAVPELIAQLESDASTNGNDYDRASPNGGLNLAYTRLDNHLQGIYALADLIRCHHTTAALGHPSLTEYHAGGLHAALCELSFSAIQLMETIHESLTQDKAP